VPVEAAAFVAEAFVVEAASAAVAAAAQKPGYLQAAIVAQPSNPTAAAAY